jgi:putative ATP-binding cassette transporter
MLFRHSRGAAALAVAAGVLSGAANAGLLALVNTALFRPRPWEDTRLVAGFVALCVLLPLARGVSSYLLSVLGQRTVLRLRMELSRKMLAAPLRRLEEVGSPRLLVALTEDVSAVVSALSALPLLSVQGAIVLGSLLYLGWLSPLVLGAVAGALAVGILSYQIPMRRGAAYQRRMRESADRLYGHFRAITGGIKELKLHAERQTALMDELHATGLQLRHHTVRASTLFSTGAGWGQLVIFAVVGFTLFVVPRMAPVEQSTLTGYALIVLYMMTPLQVILDTVPLMSRARVALARVQALGISLGAGAELPPAAPAAPFRSLELSGVTHAYHREGEEESFTFGPVDARFTPGEVVFVTGGNGSGKTTFAKLITGLYAPESGEVLLNGRPVADAERTAFQQNFSAVFTDFFLFDRLLGLDAPDIDSRAAHYLGRLRLRDKVRVEGGRLSTTELSQGQCKRLALLTAYLEDRPVYLFDEWAADQDPVFKAFFYHELLPELRRLGKTVIVISHDDHYFGTADRLLKLEYGQLEYDGPPERLPYAGTGPVAEPARA